MIRGPLHENNYYSIPFVQEEETNLEWREIVGNIADTYTQKAKDIENDDKRKY